MVSPALTKDVDMNKRHAAIGLAVGGAILGFGLVNAQAHGNDLTPASTGKSMVQTLENGISSFMETVGLDQQVAPGTLDDGKDLLQLATISLEDAVVSAQTAGSGAVGEVDLEYYNGTLVFNVDIGDLDVKVDAATGAVLGSGKD